MAFVDMTEATLPLRSTYENVIAQTRFAPRRPARLA